MLAAAAARETTHCKKTTITWYHLLVSSRSIWQVLMVAGRDLDVHEIYTQILGKVIIPNAERKHIALQEKVFGVWARMNHDGQTL